MRKNFIYLTLSMLMAISGCATNTHMPNSTPKIDRISAEELARMMPKPVAAISLDDVVDLTKAGNSADQIIEKIKSSNSLYDLTPSQSVALSKQGVDSKVLDYIHASYELALQNNLADEINKREAEKRAALDKLKNQQWQQQRLRDSYCRSGYYGSYGYGAYHSHFGSRYGFGAGYGRPLGCW